MNAPECRINTSHYGEYIDLLQARLDTTSRYLRGEHDMSEEYLAIFALEGFLLQFTPYEIRKLQQNYLNHASSEIHRLNAKQRELSHLICVTEQEIANTTAALNSTWRCRPRKIRALSNSRDELKRKLSMLKEDHDETDKDLRQYRAGESYIIKALTK